MNRKETTHPSAFCLMTFRTLNRNVEEVVWNSRDMAVPDKIPHGKIELDHVDPHRDEFKPFHVPRVGTRMFIDPVLDKAEAWSAEFYAEHEHDEDFGKQFTGERHEILAKLVAEQLGRMQETGIKRGPVLVVVTADLVAKVQARLAKRGIL